MKLSIIAASMIAVVLIVLPHARIQAQPLQVRSASFQQLRAAVDREGPMRVIVRMNMPLSIEAADDVRQQRALETSQQPVAALVSSELQWTVRPYALLPYVAMTVDRDTLDRLESSAAVAEVFEDRVVKPALLHSMPLIGATTAWSRRTGLGWTIAVIDSGVERSHPFLANKIVAEACFDSVYWLCGGAPKSTAFGSSLPCPGPSCYHGTFVAGIALGNGASGGVGFNGVAPNASLLPIKVYTVDGDVGANMSDVDAALLYVYQLRQSYPIGAVNLSMGVDGYTTYCDYLSPSTAAAIALLRSAGIPTIIASGNNGYINGLSFPSCLSGAVSVGATVNATWGVTDAIWDSSNRASFLSLMAPGYVIQSSDLSGSYSYGQGTSYAAPHVAGAMTLLRQLSPSSSVSTLVEALRNTGKPTVDSYTGQTYYRIQVDRALNSFAPAGDLQVIPWNYDGDFQTDLFLYNRVTGAWTIKTGDLVGGFSEGPSGGWAAGWNITVGDFNRDGRDDLFLYNQSTGAWYKVTNGFSGFTYFTQGWQPGFRILPGDFNRDGRADLFVYNPTNGVWFLCLSAGDGTGGFDYRSGQWAANWQVFTADFNGDSRTDLFLYSRVSGLYYKVITQADSSFAYTAVDVWGLRWTPYIMDLNGDGRSDVFLYDNVSGVWYRCVSTGDGTGGFAYTVGQWAPGWSIYPAELNLGGPLDLFLYNQATGAWYRVVNDGTSFSYTAGSWGIWNITVMSTIPSKPTLFLYSPTTRVWYTAQVLSTSGSFTLTSGKFY